jgi:hypothetical protein
MKLVTEPLAMLGQSPAQSLSRWGTDWLAIGLVLIATAAASAQSADEAPPWKTNPPIVTVKKELYR